jgi:predicted NAD-dependent protein-ADP-ribosyltransferase YbiA (DUF1768 family)
MSESIWKNFKETYLESDSEPIQVQRFHVLIPGIVPLPVTVNPITGWDQVTEIPQPELIYTPYGVFEKVPMESKNTRVVISNYNDPLSITYQENFLMNSKYTFSSLYQAILVAKAVNGGYFEKATQIQEINDISSLIDEARSLSEVIGWESKRHKFMYQAAVEKYSQSDSFKQGLKQLNQHEISYEIIDTERYWCQTKRGTSYLGQNAYGHILEAIREKFIPK